MKIEITPIPRKLLNFIPLQDFFNDFGSHIYGMKWDYTELIAIGIPSLVDAQKLIEEESVASKKITERYGHSDDDYLSHIEFMTNELDGEDVYSTDAKEYKHRVIVSNIISLRKLISTIPDVNQEDLYNARYAAFLRKIDVEAKIKDILANERLIVYHRADNGRENIKQELCASLNIHLLLELNQIVIGKRVFNKVEFCISDTQRVIQEFTSAGTEFFQNKSDVHNMAYAELVKMMTGSKCKELTKVSILPDFMKKYHPHLSKRRFDYLWNKAAMETGSGLNKGGRRPQKN